MTTQIEKTFDDVEVIYVQTTFEGHSINDFDRAREERGKWKISGPVGHDSPADESDRPYIMKAYRTGGTPWTIIIDKRGRIRFNDFTRAYAFTERFIAALR